MNKKKSRRNMSPTELMAARDTDRKKRSTRNGALNINSTRLTNIALTTMAKQLNRLRDQEELSANEIKLLAEMIKVFVLVEKERRVQSKEEDLSKLSTPELRSRIESCLKLLDN